MLMHRIRKENLQTISYTIFNKWTLSAKFKVKIYNSQGKYFQQDYLLNNNGTASTILEPYYYIEVVVRDNDSRSDYFILNDIMKNRLVRKLSKLTTLLEGYDSKEVDILVETQDGTKIHSEVAQPIIIEMGTQKVGFKPIFEFGKVSIFIEYNDIRTTVSLLDFLLFYQRIKDINYSETALSLLTYYSTYEISDNNINDKMVSPITDDREIELPNSVINNNPLSSIESIPQVNNNIDKRKVKW